MTQNNKVTFELLVFSGSRWETQGVYDAGGQHTALADAKALARVSTVKGVKVVKETHDAQSGVTRTQNIYEHSPKQPSPKQTKKPPGKARAKVGKTSVSSGRGNARGTKPAEKQKRDSLLTVFVKILLAGLFSLAAAMAVTQLASMMLREMNVVGLLSRGDFLNLVFIFVFVVTALALVTRILSGLKKIPGSLIGGLKPRVEPTPPRRVRNQSLTPSAEPLGNALPGQKQESLKTNEAIPQVPVKADREDQAELARQAELQQRLPEDAKAAREAQQQADAVTAKNRALDAAAETALMGAFAEDAFDVLQGDKSKQDAHTVFGLVLFLVGAVQALRFSHQLSETVANTVMASTLNTLGVSPERAQHFSENIDEYLISNPRYSEMFQNGRTAMGGYLESQTGPRGAMSDALAGWDKPKSKNDAAPQPVTVLFTDIAGSTAMTQELGDAGAQEVVRCHNRIVREAISGFSGKEIKHTGDGIMASFPSASAGVEAAMEMQTRTKAHNAQEDGHPLGLKIGLNIGEPISEDDDLFGTTVQLAARIVDKAQAGQVLVSSSVHGLSQGKTLKFARFADLDMKGFDDPVTVYEVVWDEDKPAAETPQTPPQKISSPPPTTQT